MNFAASAVSTKPSAVNGQIRLTSRWERRYISAAKKTASKATPRRMFGFIKPRRITRNTSAATIRSGSPICLRPWLRNTTPPASKPRASSRTISTLVMLQIAVTNQPHPVFPDERAIARADQRLEFIPKFVEGRMGVKLRIAGGQPRDHPGDILLVYARVLQEAEDGQGVFDAKPAKDAPRPLGQQPENQRVAGAVEKISGNQPQIQPEEIAGESEMRDVPGARMAHQNPKDHGM